MLSFLCDIVQQERNGDFTFIVRVEIESVSHCGNWAIVRWEHQKTKSMNSMRFSNRPLYINTRLLMTEEEANLTKKSTVPKIGDLVNNSALFTDKKNYLVSKVNKATIHRLDPETGKNQTVSFRHTLIITRDGKTYNEN